VSNRTEDPYGLSRAERERQETWAVMAQLALRRGAGAMLPGKFPPDVEAKYQELRAKLEAMRAADEGGKLDVTAHEQLRTGARGLLARLGAAG
jgi:hypothetical protein